MQISASKEAGFDFPAIIIFRADFTVKGAVVVPYIAIWELAVHQNYNRVR